LTYMIYMISKIHLTLLTSFLHNHDGMGF
jgi:hypothetical protein